MNIPGAFQRLITLFWLLLLLIYSHHPGLIEALNTTLIPQTISIGSLIDFDSTFAPAVKQSIELAVEDVNKESSTLFNGSQLSLQIFNTNNSAFKAAAAAMELFKNEVVAIVGPQVTTGSHFVAHMATTLQVPIVSYGVTDPALSEEQYPFFLRLSHSDIVQMKAIAALIKHFGWRIVVALYTDDDYGANGIAALQDALQQAGSSVLRKEPLSPDVDRSGIGRILSKLALMESRIFVVHAHQEVGLKVFGEANYLGMINTGFVWIVTDLVAATLMETMHSDLGVAKQTQGIVGLRRYIPQSAELKDLSEKWEQLPGRVPSELNVYALCAYDAVWMIAKAISVHLKHQGNLDFEDQQKRASRLDNMDSNSELLRLKILKQGSSLRDRIIQTKLKGTTGTIKLNKKGDIQFVAFEIVNMVGRGVRVIGYWHNDAGITALPPETTSNNNQQAPPLLQQLISTPKVEQTVKLPDIIWPGGGSQAPRGWVIPQNGSPLRIGVPRKEGYKELIRLITDANNFTTFHGFCINVFESAIQYLPYAVSYEFLAYGSGAETPVYDDLISKLANKEYDGVVGDSTITTKRLDLVDFTQPYMESGLEIIVPWKNMRRNNEWAFLQPFTPAMWVTTGTFFLFTGAVIWTLEHRTNYAFRGRPQKQIVTSLWFIFSTLFFAQREKTKTVLGRAVVIIWLFVVLIITSSYTASLTSILTVQQLAPAMGGINNLLESDVPIGYQMGSFVRNYLIELGVKPERLIPLSSKVEYAKALIIGPNNGGVAAIVDEHPYVQLFLASQGNAVFTTAGQGFTKGGWGFAFPKYSPLTADLSEAILKMSENGELQKIHNLWFNRKEAISKDTEVDSSQLDLRTFSGLFLITGLASVFCLFIYLLRLLLRFNKSWASQNQASISSSRASSFSKSKQFLRSFILYLDEPAGDCVLRKERENTAVSHMLDITPVSSLERDT